MRLYRFLSALALAAYGPYALLRSAAGGRKIGSVRGKLGREPYPDLAGGVWVHAVSVGEVGVAHSILAELSRRAPGARLGLSSTTAAGLDLARRTAPSGVAVFTFPLDLAGPVDRALGGVRPGLILLTETEIWPLLLSRAGAKGIGVALVNGRVSERSFRRYRRLGRWFARVLAGISFFAMQTEEDADRMRCLGADPARVRVTGNVKYDLPAAPPFPDSERLLAASGGLPLMVAASTGEGEEEMVLSAWESLRQDGRPALALAPRRPERFDAVAETVERRGHALVRRSAARAGSPPAAEAGLGTRKSCVYLLDSIGELASLYREACLAFIGGSLIPAGGHNPIEAWAAGVPVLVGPHTGNFREVTEDGERLGILERVDGAPALARAVAAAISDPDGLARRSERARQAVAESRGAAARAVDLVLSLLAEGGRKKAVSG